MLRDHASFQADYPSDGEPGRVANDGVRQWLFLLESELPAWRRWFGATDAAAHEAVLRAAQRVIALLPGARAIRWYTLAEWNEAPDDQWSSDPAA